MTALHATEASTPFLSLHARVRSIAVSDVEAVLYDERSLVRVMAMRRTLWIVLRDLVPAVAGSAGRRVADVQAAGHGQGGGRTRGHVRPRLDHDGVAAGRRVPDRTGTLGKTVARRIPDLAGTFTAAPGTKWSTEVPIMTRLLVILSAGGEVVRGRNDGHWRISRPMWTSMNSWLGEPMVPTSPETGYAEIVRRLLWTFGPVTEDDLVWWLGSTKGAVRDALADGGAIEVRLESGSTGWVLPNDTADLGVAPRDRAVGRTAADARSDDDGLAGPRLLPRPVAHAVPLRSRRQRRNDGVGRRTSRRLLGAGCNERVELILMEDVSAEARRLLDVEVARLDEFLRGEHITNVFASPQMKHQRLS